MTTEQPPDGQRQDAEGDEDEVDSPLPGFASITQFSNESIKKILGATRAFQSLPSSGPAWDLQKSYPQFNKTMAKTRNKLVNMITSLMKHANIPTEEFRFGDMDEKFDYLVEANDDMLERIGKALDEASGLFKKTETLIINQGAIAAAVMRPPGNWGKRKALAQQSGPTESPEAETKVSNREIKRAIYKRSVKEKPQNKFKTPVDNSFGPFVPKLKEKPNSIKPLSILPEYNAKNEEFYGHPYAVELNKWEPFDSMLTKVNPQKPLAIDNTPLVEVNSVRDIESLLKDLYPVSELAIDLEHHAYRSFLGLTCLIQISTRTKDYVIDALALREHLYHLNEIFTNPKIIKVFHGSSSDIEWLQKDFGLYVVNMFDTQLASKVLGFPQLGLQYLLDKYCESSQNKAFQLADWRIRPLPKEMLHYARCDTHSLLYIADMMRNELIDCGNERKNLLLSVYDQSKLVCLKRFEKPGNNPKLALRKMRRSLNNRQVYAFTELYNWRDAIAREKDESIAYVLPNHMLLTIAEQLPKEMTGILACCDPVPPLLQSGLGTLHKMLTNARALPLQENSREEKSEKRQKLKDWVVLMNSMHDVELDELVESSSSHKEPKEFDEEEHSDSEEKMETSEIPVFNKKTFYNVPEWPVPLKELPAEQTQNLINTGRPSVFFNTKLTAVKKTKPSLRNSSGYSVEPAATPFDRYKLSVEILDLLRDPKKAEGLDMKNPVVKALYETVLCDPSELAQGKKEIQISQPLEKVFTDGEFIPFNPLGGESAAKPSRKRKRQDDTWDDGVKAEPESEPKPKLIKDDVMILEDGELDEVDQDEATLGLPDFMSVPNTGPEGKKKKRKKGNKIMQKLKNSFHKGKAPKSEAAIVDVKVKKDSPSKSNRKGENSRRESPRGKNKDPNNKNKKGKFFDFKNRGGGAGKSMTFK